MKVPTFLLFLFVASGLVAANLPVKRVALFVGANQGASNQEPLLYAQKDALKMQQVMQEVGGVTVADRILLLDPTPEEVREALVALAGRLTGLGGENRRTEFLFYYSGHSDEQGLLLGERSLSYKALRDGLQSVPADVRIAILDSCSSGAFARLKGGVQRAPFLDQESSQMKGHAFLTSSSENEASQESDTLQGSFFTHYLVSGLRGGADKVGDGLITLNEAYEYAFQNTLARTESTRAGPQHPSYEIQLSGTGNLVLSDVKTSTARLELAPDVAGKLYVRNPQGQLFAEVSKESGTPLTLAFPSGAYTVTAVTAQKSLSSRVVLTAAGPTRLGARDFQEQDLARFATRGSVPEPPVPKKNEPEPSTEGVTPVTLNVIPGIPGTGWGGEKKTLALAALIDLAAAVRGIQASGVMSINSEETRGIQAAGVGSISEGNVAGLQGSGVFNIASNGISGAQMSGVFNLALGPESSYFQSAGVFNLAQGTFRGVQTAGVVNIADTLLGSQFAVVNIAGEVKGVQVGIVNINSHIEGAGIGLIQISPDAYYHPKVLWDETGSNWGVFQWGMGWLYWTGGVVGKEPWKTGWPEAWQALGGIGYKVEDRRLYWDTDIGWFSMYQQATYLSGSPYLKSGVGLDAGLVGLEVGAIITKNLSGRDFTVGPLSATARWYAGIRLF